MPLASKPAPHRRAIMALVLLAVAAGAGAAACMVREVGQQERFTELSARGEALLSRVTGAETGQRGFLLTGRDSYLDPYEAAVAAIPAELDELARLADGEPALRGPVAGLQRSVPAKLEELARTVALRREAGAEATMAVVETDAGRAMMDAIRAQTAELRASADTLRIVAQQGALWLTLCAGGVAAAAAGAAIALLSGAVRRGRRAEATLAEAEEQFRATFEQAAVGIAHVGLDGRWLRVNDRLCAITGYPRSDLLTLTFQDITHPEDLETDLAQVRALLAGRIATYAMEKRYLRKDGSAVWVNLTVSLLRDAAGRPERFVSVIEDVSVRRGAERALAESEARLRAVLDNLFAFVVILAPDGTLLDANRAPLEAAGIALGDVRGRAFWDCPWWTHDAAAQDRVRVACRRAAAGEASRFDASIKVAGDGRMAIDFQIAPLRDAEGRVTHLIPSAVEITERKRAEERQALLMREVDHRAKNALAVALSLVRLTPREDAARFAADVEGRIAAMARAHSLLAKQRWGGADLRTLAVGELAAHAGQVRFSGPPVRLAAEAAQPVAMLLHELATNAAKHGALSTPEGAVDVDWAFAGDEGGLRLRWRESGGPPVEGPPGRKGFGSRLVAQLAERQLGGRLALDWEASGLRATLGLPPRLAALDREGAEVAGAPPMRREGGPAALSNGGAAAALARPPRVLVVEDEALLAMELEGVLRTLGAEVVGPARNLAEGVRLAVGAAPLDAAVLDVNLGNGERSFPVVDVLATRGVPYVFATGYASAGSLEGREAAAVAVLRKPYAADVLARALGVALRGERGPEVGDCACRAAAPR